MRILIVLISGLGLIFIVSMSWWLTLPIIIPIARAANSTVTLPAARLTINAIEYAEYIWGPLFVVIIVLWMLINAQKRDVESEIYQ